MTNGGYICGAPPCVDTGEGRVPPAVRPRRFPPPWSVAELNACFVVRDDNGQKLAYVYFEDEPGRRSAANLLTRRSAAHRGEYRQAAGAIARGPLIGKADVRTDITIWQRRATSGKMLRTGFGWFSLPPVRRPQHCRG
jgi:hypothetical protein